MNCEGVVHENTPCFIFVWRDTQWGALDIREKWLRKRASCAGDHEQLQLLWLWKQCENEAKAVLNWVTLEEQEPE